MPGVAVQAESRVSNYLKNKKGISSKYLFFFTILANKVYILYKPSYTEEGGVVTTP